MSQNTEQKVRTQEDQARAIANAIRTGYGNLGGLTLVVAKELQEAEARGAAELRRKGAEIEALKISRAHSDGVRNEKQKRINTLEAEIAELKKALRHVTWTASEYGLGKIGHESAVNRARAALTREGGV